MSALISLFRPGCLRSLIDGKPMTEHYCDRKNAGVEVKYFHQALEPILKSTYGVLTYQEQSMKIAQDIAGFTLEEADTLRKAIGKKKADIMAQIKQQFIDGCKKVGLVTEEEAAEIFGWIQESQRYSFNACLSPTTIVETESGLKTLEEVSIGDKVNAPSDSFEEDEFVEVMNKFDNGQKMLYEIETESGLTIQCTLDHQFLCEDGKIRPLMEIIDKNHKIGV
jgi:DNA polymerase-3 subunit alpha